MKKSLIFVLALMLVLAFASSAMAAQVRSDNSYMATTPTSVTIAGYAPAGSTITKVYSKTKFNNDGKTNYPYEIYLPNEQNPTAYRIHSSYTKNTDACASCHSTHTAVGNYLLQWYSTYETCMACHDGTVTTTYNVVAGKVGAANTIAAGGMFGIGVEKSLSNHSVTGAMEIAAAPGGSVSDDSHGKWAVEFGCESCHAPHGNGGNARLLEPNPNGYASKLAIANGIGGNFTYISGGLFYDKKPSSGGVVLATQPVGLKAATTGTISDVVYINGVFEKISVQGKTYYIAKPATLRDSLTDAVGAGYTFLKPGRESGFAITVNGVMEQWDSGSYGPKNWIIDNSTGVTRAIYIGTGTIAGTDVVKFFGTPTVKVTMDIRNYLNNGIANPSPAQKEAVFHGSGMNVFCGACHLDYNTASKEVYDLRNDGRIGGAYAYDTGVYSKAHRHTVGTLRTVNTVTDVLDYEWAAGKTSFDTRLNSSGAAQGTFTCLTCHVAHGTSYDYWATLLAGKNGPSGDAWDIGNANTGGTNYGELVELAGSSVLKRMPNMGTCETCHNKEAAQDGYMANSTLGATPAIPAKPVIGVTDAGQAGATFVGSAKCAPCHAETVESYKETAHGQMTDIIEGNATEQQKWYDKLAAIPSYNAGSDANGQYVQLESVDLSVYKFYKQDFVLSVSWDHNTLAAVSTNAGDSLGKLYVLYEAGPFTEAEEYTCITCHNTPKNAASSTWATTKAKIAAGTMEPGIQCETSGCHGNGSKHINSPSSLNIKNPGAFAIQDQSGANSCGECHSSKHHQGEFWGGKVTAGVMAAGWTDWNNLRESAGATPWEEVQKAPSQMYSGKLVSCITCHTPHSSNVQDIARDGVTPKTDLQLKLPVRALCNGCHENRLVTKADFDKYLPLKANGMPSHLFNGQGYPTIPADATGYNPATVVEHRTE